MLENSRSRAHVKIDTRVFLPPLSDDLALAHRSTGPRHAAQSVRSDMLLPSFDRAPALVAFNFQLLARILWELCTMTRYQSTTVPIHVPRS